MNESTELLKELLKAIFCHQKAGKLCMKFSSTSNIVHGLEPKNMGILLRQVKKT